LRTCVQVPPLFVEVQIWPEVYTTAASRVPSAEEAMEYQTVLGALVCCHVTPLLVEVQMPPPFITAASRVPSAEEAMEYQLVLSALVWAQLVPAAPGSEFTTRPGMLSVALVAGRTEKPPTYP